MALVPDFDAQLARARRKVLVYNEQLKWDEWIVRQVLAEVTLDAREELARKRRSPRWTKRKRRAPLRVRLAR